MTEAAAEQGMRVGVAGWSIPKAYAANFGIPGTHLERYSRRFSAVEINSSFYKPHMPKTYERWAASVPSAFKFAVKMPKEITHQKKLSGAEDAVARFLDEAQHLAAKLGPVLIQLPPSLKYDRNVATAFFDDLRQRFTGSVVCEPRHATWFTAAVDRVLQGFHIARVAADPPLHPRASSPGGWNKLVYRRMHSAPRIYYSDYAELQVNEIAKDLRNDMKSAEESWCIFDNTALGHATGNALHLTMLLHLRQR